MARTAAAGRQATVRAATRRQVSAMTTKLSLTELKQTIETKYGPVEVDLGDGDIVTLHPILRLPREKRATVQGLLKQISSADDEDLNALGDTLADLIRAVCPDTAAADRLLASVGDDVQLMQALFESYQERTSLGDPSPSES